MSKHLVYALGVALFMVSSVLVFNDLIFLFFMFCFFCWLPGLLTPNLCVVG